MASPLPNQSTNLCASLRVSPGHPLNGEVILPGDKSLSHRAALFAALANGDSRIENFLVSGVTQAMLEALSALEVEWKLHGKTLWVHGQGIKAWQSPAASLNCGNSATTLRLLAGALAAAGIEASLDGSPGLRRRPMERIVAPLQLMGVPIEATQGCAPLILHGRTSPLRPITYSLSVASAQVKTCLLLAALVADGPTTLFEPGPSRDHTERMLSSMGVKVTIEHLSGTTSPEVTSSYAAQPYSKARLAPLGERPLSPLEMRLPGDISAAAFLIVAALITPGSEVTLRGVGLNPTRTGLLEALQAMGADLQITNQAISGGEPAGDITVRHSLLHGVECSGNLVVRMIDEFPAFAVAAAYANGLTTVREAEELRHKESDRISALSQELRHLGAAVEELPDGFRIQGSGALTGGEIHPHGDHRLAMALAVAGLAARDPVEVRGAQIIGESFPDFAGVLCSLGAQVELDE